MLIALLVSVKFVIYLWCESAAFNNWKRLCFCYIQMSVQEFPANATMIDLLERAGRGSTRWAHYRFPVKEELRPRLNQEPVSDPKCKLKMGDVVELTPPIPDTSLIEYREEIQRMYERGFTVATPQPAGWMS